MIEKENTLQSFGKELLMAIQYIYNRHDIGFALLIFEFNSEDGLTDYISNANREDIIKYLRETAARLENKDNMPTIIGIA